MKETILSELERFKNKGKRHTGITEEDFDILVQFFQNYFGGREGQLIRESYLENEMDIILKEPDEFTYNLIQGIKSYPRDKAVMTIRIIKYLEYLEIRYDVSFKKYEFENFKINNQSERLLTILKYLHSGDKKRPEIADAFGISERTLSEDLFLLLEGFEFLGTEIRIPKLERGTNNYRSHVHPIFLALNSAEIFAMVVGLKLVGKDTVFEESFNRIASMVYKQLSPHARNLIDATKYVDVSSYEEPLKFLNSLEANERQDIRLSYFLKDRTVCDVTYIENEKNNTLTGILSLVKEDEGYILNKVKLFDGSITTELDINDIVQIERSDREEYFKSFI